eukprot:1850909-Prymnesium_polylepis.1
MRGRHRGRWRPARSRRRCPRRPWHTPSRPPAASTEQRRGELARVRAWQRAREQPVRDSGHASKSVNSGRAVLIVGSRGGAW